MRNAFAKELVELAARDERIVLLSGDIGNRLFDDFKKRYPQRFYNCGVAEANMIGVAAGMALSGLRPITYTIASFAIFRAVEQIKVDLCYHGLPVTVTGVGGGLSYAENGATHLSCEDIALMRSLPNMKVVCPGDPAEVRLALRACLAEKGPVYLRLGKKGEPAVHQDLRSFVIGKAIPLFEGKDVCIAAAGNVLPMAVAAAEELSKKGLSAGVMSFHTVKPLDETALAGAFQRCRLVVTLEEHSVRGGLGSAAAEWLAAAPQPGRRLLSIGTEDRFLHEAGRQEHYRGRFGLTPRSIAEKAEAAWRGLAAG